MKLDKRSPPAVLRSCRVGRNKGVDLHSKWFQAYRRAVLENDREIAQIYIEDALTSIREVRTAQVADTEERPWTSPPVI
jgi:hypothetical protein